MRDNENNNKRRGRRNVTTRVSLMSAELLSTGERLATLSTCCPFSITMKWGWCQGQKRWTHMLTRRRCCRTARISQEHCRIHLKKSASHIWVSVGDTGLIQFSFVLVQLTPPGKGAVDLSSSLKPGHDTAPKTAANHCCDARRLSATCSHHLRRAPLSCASYQLKPLQLAAKTRPNSRACSRPCPAISAGGP